MKKTIGIMGGMGPKATEFLYEMIIDHTNASKDQEHIDMIIINRATTPDRTAYILDNTNESPVKSLIRDVKILESCCDMFALACNTSHTFADELLKETSLPFINMIEETVKNLKNKNRKKIAVLSTSGTLKSEVYQNMLTSYGMEYYVPDEELQKKVMRVIYDEVKAGNSIDRENFLDIEYTVIKRGCDAGILGCTELSTVADMPFFHRDFYVDSSESLARAIIREGGGEWI